MTTVLLFHASADLYGSDRALLSLVQALRSAGWTTHVALPVKGPLVESLEGCGAEVHLGGFRALGRRSLRPLALLLLPFQVIFSLFRCGRLMCRIRPDLVHVNTLVLLVPAMAGWLIRRPVVWHIHEIMIRPRLLASGLARTVALLASHVVCNSQATLRWLLEQAPGVEGKACVIANGVSDLGLSSGDDLAEQLGLASDRFTFLFIGRLNAWKGQELFLRAAARILTDHPKACFLVAGDAPPGQDHFRQSFLDLAHGLAMGDSFHWLGFRSDTQDLYGLADVVIVPSTLPEPFGLVAAEAMCAGRAVIAAGHGGLAEIVEDGVTGLLVKPGDLEALVSSMGALAVDPGRARSMGEAGRTRQQRLFSVDRYQQEFLRLYGQVQRGSGAA